LGRQKDAKVGGSTGAGGRGGAGKLAKADPGIGFTRLAPCRRHGAADIILTTPTAIHRRPSFFGVRLSNKRQELSGTFLAVRGRPEEPEKKQSSGWKFS
jgi:hypothetical protein